MHYTSSPWHERFAVWFTFYKRCAYYRHLSFVRHYSGFIFACIAHVAYNRKNVAKAADAATYDFLCTEKAFVLLIKRLHSCMPRCPPHKDILLFFLVPCILHTKQYRFGRRCSHIFIKTHSPKENTYLKYFLTIFRS